MGAFLKFILITIVIFYVLSWLGKVWLRYFVGKKQEEFNRQFGGQQQYNAKQARRSREGEVRVQQTSRDNKKVSGDVGDYVEYEEVEYEETE